MSVENWPPSKCPAHIKRFMREHLIATLLYVAVMWGSAWTLNSFEPPLWGAVLLALAPVAPALLMLRAYMRALSGMDELQRRIQHEAILIAVAIVGFGSFAYAMLEGVGAAPAIPHALIFVLPAMIAAWGVTLMFVTRRYR